jgi:multiple sugar transport system substrate-binding protein
MIKLKGITWDHARGYDPLIVASALYLKETGIQIEWQKRSLTNFGDQSLETLAQQFDLIIIDHPHVGVAEASNCITAFDDLLDATQLEQLQKHSAGPSFESYQYRNKQWALPIDAAMQCASSRLDLLNDASLPTNWEEVFALANFLKTKNLYVGMALCPTDCLCSFLSLTAQLGSPITENNKQLVDPILGIKALEMLRRMRDQFHAKALDWNPIALYDHMSNENEIAYSPLAFCYTNYSRDGFRKNILSYHNAPTTKQTVLGGAGIAITSTCTEKTAAANFAAWICGDLIQSTIYVQAQGQPGNKMAWENTAANAHTNNFFTQTLDTLTHAYVRPRYQGWPHFQQWLGEKIHAFLLHDTSAELLLKTLEAGYQNSYQFQNK